MNGIAAKVPAAVLAALPAALPGSLPGLWPGAVPDAPGAVWCSPAGTAAGRLLLLPHKAAFDPDLGLLLVADAHIGKAVSFRRLGVPVPAGSTATALARLDALLALTGAQGIVFLGDFLHSVRAHAAGTMAAVAAWRVQHATLNLTLVRGNHDQHAGDPPAALGIRVLDGPLAAGPWALAHQPDPVPGRYTLAGHVHPGVALGGRGGGSAGGSGGGGRAGARGHDRLRLPCFHFGPQVGVLPAFGPFTGLHLLARSPADQVFAVAAADTAESAESAGLVLRV